MIRGDNKPEKQEKGGLFHRKKKDLHLYDKEMGYIGDDKDSDFSLDEEFEDDKDSFDETTDETGEVEAAKRKKGLKELFSKIKKKDTDDQKEPEEDKTMKLAGGSGDTDDEFMTDEEVILAEPEKKKFSRKKLALIGGTAAVIVIAVVFFIVRNAGGGSEGSAYVESVREVTGLGSANGANNRYTGVVDAQSSWKVTLQSDMSVEKRYVNVGDQVKKGDKLFKYNTEELKLSKEKKELEVETLENEITQLNKDIKSYQSDLKSASASEKIQLQTEILTAQTTIKKDQYSIKSDKASIKTIEKNIKDATVKSKMSGLVKKINTSLESSSSDDSGDSSDSDSYDDGSSSDGDTTYMTILAVGNYRVTGTISETNVSSINEGDQVIVRSRVDDSQTWTGTISKIKTDATADEDSSSSSDEIYTDSGDDTTTGESASKYNFYVKLDSDKGLMMGQHVLIEQDDGQDETKSGMWLPSAYIKKDGDNYYVWLASHSKLKLHKITVGEYDENLDEYEVKDGLKITDYIASDNSTLEEGMKVTKVSPEDSTSDDGATGLEYEDTEEY